MDGFPGGGSWGRIRPQTEKIRVLPWTSVTEVIYTTRKTWSVPDVLSLRFTVVPRSGPKYFPRTALTAFSMSSSPEARAMTSSPEVAFEQHRERLLSVIYLRMGPERPTGI